MKKSIITADFIKDIIVDMFAKNSEGIIISDLNSGEEKEYDLAKWLNIEFYSWQNKVDTANDFGYSSVDEWVESIANSLDNSYGLVEIIDQKATQSPDIDNGVINGRITFLTQMDKTTNLDYYVTKIRNAYMGKPITIQNSYGGKVKAFLMLGGLVYDEEPSNTQIGFSAITACNFKLSYMSFASSYEDIKIEMSLDNGKHFYEVPMTNETWQMITTSDPLPMVARPDITGQKVKTISAVKTFTMYDFDSPFFTELNRIFWGIPAILKNNLPTKRRTSLNIPVIMRMTYGGDVYEYSDIIDNVEKVVTNGTFNVTSIGLKSNADEIKRDIKYYTNSGGNFVDTHIPDKPSPIIGYIGLKPNVRTFVIGNYLPLDKGDTNTYNFSTSLFIEATQDCTIDFDISVRQQNGDIVEQTGGSSDFATLDLVAGVPIQVFLQNTINKYTNVDNISFTINATSKTECDIRVVNDTERANALYITRG